MHADESEYLSIGQEATTIGNPTLKMAKMPANANPMILCRKIDFIYVVEPTRFLLRSLEGTPILCQKNLG